MKPQPRYKPGDKIGGRYQVYKVLMGGMGEVYLDRNLGGTTGGFCTVARLAAADPRFRFVLMAN